MLDGNALKNQFAGVLLYEIGLPRFFTQKPTDITLSARLVKSIKENGQTRLLIEASEKCADCTYSGSCQIEMLFQAD